jgi:hypothetical protein
VPPKACRGPTILIADRVPEAILLVPELREVAVLVGLSGILVWLIQHTAQIDIVAEGLSALTRSRSGISTACFAVHVASEEAERNPSVEHSVAVAVRRVRDDGLNVSPTRKGRFLFRYRCT